ncbi:ABC transporter permease [Brevibacterium luteolum]|uniref:ABC transporter permease n=1 Tax=Brevibacterium luteolum TaxID=199591 RepID=UPI00223B967F|nr:ABC transporter permease [Brevibacterium luteolum]MCT1921451.1 ABC transporter permease [Brevibacterium luteolum]
MSDPNTHGSSTAPEAEDRSADTTRSADANQSSQTEQTQQAGFFTRRPLLTFILRRILLTFVTLLGVIVVVFFLIQLVPGDPVRIALGTRYTDEAYQALQQASGLDKPLIVQFFSYIGSALIGDLGVSFRNGEPVMLLLLERLPATISLALCAIFVALLIAIPLGTIAGLREGGVIDSIVRVISQFGVSIPDFWMGMMLISVFALGFGWPSSGYTPLTEDPVGWATHMVLPAITAGVVSAAILTRFIRTAVIDVSHATFVRTATSKGLKYWTVLTKHIGRNALIPVLTIAGIQLATLLGGVIVVEVVFAYPGLGRLIYDAVAARDYPLLQGAILLIAFIFLTINLLVDVLYAIIDPRIRIS